MGSGAVLTRVFRAGSALLVAVALSSASARAQEAPPEPERRMLELDAGAGPRFARHCLDDDCLDLPPGFGVSIAGGVRMHPNVSAGFLVDQARFSSSVGDTTVGYTLVGAFGRGYWLARGAVDPYLELAFVGARPIGGCGPRSDALGGIGYRAAAGTDAYLTRWLRLGLAAGYASTSQGCAVAALDSGQTASSARPPLVLSALGIDAVLTLVGP